MSNTPSPRQRHEWMPNRMFDAASNPFAVQNLLQKQADPFVVTRDERAEFNFKSDPVVAKEKSALFKIDELMDPPFATDAAFSGETEATTDFVAEAGQANPEFTAEETQGADFVAGPLGELSQEEAEDEALSVVAEAQSDADQDEQTQPESAEALDAGLAAEAAETTAIAETELVQDTVLTADAEPMPEDIIEPAPVAVAQPVKEDLTSEAVTRLVNAAREEGRTEVRAQAYKQGYEEGLAAGMAQIRTEFQKEHEKKLAALQAIADQLQHLSYNPDALFEPVKKLTVHLAEQLVRGELAQSPQVISRLVDNSLRELNASGDKAVIIHLNPEDLEAYRPLVASFGDSMILRPDTQLERGSIRVSLDGSVVEDMMQRRVDGLKKSLAQPAAPGWRAGGSKLSDHLAEGQRGSEHIEDLTAVEKVMETASAGDDAHA